MFMTRMWRVCRAKEILERVHWREKIKKAILKVEFCLQFAKDIKDIPPSVISENDQFCKEVAREKAKREAAKKRDLGIDTEQQRPRAVPRPQMPTSVGMPVDGVAVAEEQPAVSEERAEAIRRCFQHLMSDWDEDRECAGTSALPVTSDGKMCSENSCNSGYVNRLVSFPCERPALSADETRSLFISCLHDLLEIEENTDEHCCARVFCSGIQGETALQRKGASGKRRASGVRQVLCCSVGYAWGVYGIGWRL